MPLGVLVLASMLLTEKGCDRWDPCEGAFVRHSSVLIKMKNLVDKKGRYQFPKYLAVGAASPCPFSIVGNSARYRTANL